MQDRELYRQILGIEAPWFVERVEPKLNQGEVHIYLEHGKMATRWVYDACRFRCQKEKIRVEADRGFVAAAVRVVVGVGADDKCGETQHYREDRSARPSAAQLQAGHGAGALQVVRESHGGTEQPVSFWTLERRPGDSD